MYTAVPWQGRVLVGTHQADSVGGADTPPPSPADVEAFLSEANTAFPALTATAADVRFVHCGMVPATVRGSRVDLLGEPMIITHAQPSGIVSLVGVKYTTARLAAERAVDALRLKPSTGRTRTALLPYADVADSDGLLQETLRGQGRTLDRDVMRHLASWYGIEAAVVVEGATNDDDLERLSSETLVLCAEIRYAARQTSAVRLSDIVFRRTALASAGDPGGAAINRAGALAAEVLGWSAHRLAEELTLVRARLS